MNVVVYHEINPSDLDTVLSEGLKRTSRGEKGKDDTIAKTDKFLDAHLPKNLEAQGICRDYNLYAYVTHADGRIINIVDGSLLTLREAAAKNKQALLRLTVDDRVCYVSDLDCYDAVKKAVESNALHTKLVTMAQTYWRSLRPLASFTTGDINRPEVMIPYNVTPGNIEVIDGR